MTALNWDPGYYAAEDAEIRRLREIGNTARQRADHYSEMAAAASVPLLVGLLQEARAALGPDFFELTGRIDDALGRRA